jgi:hypothetical protein
MMKRNSTVTGNLRGMSPDCSIGVQFGALWLIDQGQKRTESEISSSNTAPALTVPGRGSADK